MSRPRFTLALVATSFSVTLALACMPPHKTVDYRTESTAPDRSGGTTGGGSGGTTGAGSGGSSGTSDPDKGNAGKGGSTGGAGSNGSGSGAGGSTSSTGSGGSSGSGSGGASGGATDAAAEPPAASGPAAAFKKQCFFPVMTGWSPDEFCEAYGEICTFGGAARYKDLADCKAKFKGFSSDADGCKAGHLCRAFKMPAMKEADCSSSAGATTCRN